MTYRPGTKVQVDLGLAGDVVAEVYGPPVQRHLLLRLAPQISGDLVLARNRPRSESAGSSTIDSSSRRVPPVSTTGTALRPGRPIWQGCIPMTSRSP
jgi:hypothetical protein